jgi:hypothetical protein
MSESLGKQWSIQSTTSVEVASIGIFAAWGRVP